MWRRKRRLWWTSGETLLTTPHWPSTARLWRESAAQDFWVCTSQRTSPGPPTPCQSPRRHNSTYTFTTELKEQVSLHPYTPSTGGPLRVCWPAASLSGTGTVVQQTATPSSGQWTQLQKSSVALSPPSWIFSLHDAPAKSIVSWRTPPIIPTDSSSSYHQEDGTGASKPAPPDYSTAFSPRLWEPWTQITPPSMKPHTNPLPPETWTLQPYHITGKKKKKTPVVTHSLLFTLDTFTHYYVYINSTKDSVICVCLHAHALQITVHCSPASCLNVFHMYSICEAFAQLFSLYFLVYV